MRKRDQHRSWHGDGIDENVTNWFVRVFVKCARLFNTLQSLQIKLLGRRWGELNIDNFFVVNFVLSVRQCHCQVWIMLANNVLDDNCHLVSLIYVMKWAINSPHQFFHHHAFLLFLNVRLELFNVVEISLIRTGRTIFNCDEFVFCSQVELALNHFTMDFAHLATVWVPCNVEDQCRLGNCPVTIA